MNAELGETIVLSTLRTKWVGRVYRYFGQTGSTNTLLKEMLATGAGGMLPMGTVLLTDFQNRGRGRLERRWDAPSGTSLLFSVLLRPDWPATQASWLTMIAALSTAEAIEAVTGLVTGVKWPNDVMINQEGIWHKVSGLLLEGDIDVNGRLAWAILGVGINVNVTAAQLPLAVTPPTSLLIACGQPVSRLTLFTELLLRLESHYEAAAQGDSPHPAWNGRLITIGQPVTVTQVGSGNIVQGVAVDTDEWGQLLVRTGSGVVQSVAAGDVTLRV